METAGHELMEQNKIKSQDNESKKEEEGGDDKNKSNSKPMTTPSSSSSRQWVSSSKNPRIVRVSRSYGGKDRHSKVCTVRGLRDRRIRLSVPTAIQLYDLQDRLGLSQPSKVIDWLIDATLHEIDKLPPLPMFPSNLLHYFHHQPESDHDHGSFIHDQPPPYASDHHLLSQSLYKERERLQNEDEDGGGYVAQLSAHNFFPFQSTAPNLSLSQFGGGFSFSDRADHHHHHHHLHHHQQQQQPFITTPVLPHYVAAASLENDQFRKINHMQNGMQNSVLMPATLHLINPPIKSFSFNPSIHSSQNETGKQEG